MKLDDLTNIKLKPVKNLVAFFWIRQEKTKTGFYLPQDYHDMGLRSGRQLIGKVLAVGSRTSALKKNDLFLFHEYGVINFEGTPNDKIIYFIEEKFCKAKLDIKNLDEMEILNIPLSEKTEARMRKVDEELPEELGS